MGERDKKKPAMAGPVKGSGTMARSLQRAPERQPIDVRQTMPGVLGRSFDTAVEQNRPGATASWGGPPTEKEIAQRDVAQREKRNTESAAWSPVFGNNDNLTFRSAGMNEALAGAGEPEVVGTRTTTRAGVSAAPKAMWEEWARQKDFEAQALAAQLDAQAAGMGLKTNLYQDLRLDQQEQVFPILQEVQKTFDDANRQLVGIQQLMDDVRANRINPGQFFANIGAAGNFAAAMAVAAGHLASAMGGGPNTALAVIDGAIERNMRAQALNQAHDRAILNAEIMVFDRMRQMGIDRLNQANVYDALLRSQALSALEAINASTASNELRAKMGEVLAVVAAQKQEALIKAAGTITSQTQMKLTGVANAAAAQANQNVFNAALQDLQAIRQSGAPDAQAKMLNRLQQLQVNQGTSLTPQQIDALRAVFEEQLGGAESSQFVVPEEQDVQTVQWRGGKLKVVPKAFVKANMQKPERDNVYKTTAALAKAEEQGQRMFELAEKVVTSAGNQGLRSLLAMEDGQFILQTGASEEAKELRTLLNQFVVQNMIATRGSAEALHGPGEWAIHLARAGIPTDTESLATMVFGGDFQGLVKPAVDEVRQNLDWHLQNYYNPAVPSVGEGASP